MMQRCDETWRAGLRVSPTQAALAFETHMYMLSVYRQLTNS
jgi:hypothetical protein